MSLGPRSAPRSEAQLDSALWGHLRRLDDSGILEPDETTIDVELAGLGVDPGALVVTDRRMLFFRSSPIRRNERSVSILLAEIEAVESSERRSPLRKQGVVRIRQGPPHDDKEYTFEHIPGGLDRANEISRILISQRDFQIRGGHGVSPGCVSATMATTTHTANDREPTLSVVVGRGVARFVREHGGQLFVWGEPIGGFEWMKASTSAPPRSDLVRLVAFDAFELYVQESLLSAGKLRLARRWLPRPSIVVDTGLVIGP